MLIRPSRKGDRKVKAVAISGNIRQVALWSISWTPLHACPGLVGSKKENKDHVHVESHNLQGPSFRIR